MEVAMPTVALTKILGVSLPEGSPLDLIEKTRQGLPRRSIDFLSKALDIKPIDLSAHLPVTWRTIQRYEADKRLSPDLSDHIVQIARVYQRCTEVIKDRQLAVKWLKMPIRGLGNEVPLDLLDTNTGVQLVLDELGRLEQGVFS
jgi:putative toxin-antitoxin system antitoxin component (TIGR02293 family)